MGALKVGSMVIEEVQNGTYKFALYMGPNLTNPMEAVILTRNNTNDDNIIDKTINSASLRNYSQIEVITQNFKPNESPIDDNVLERYIIG